MDEILAFGGAHLFGLLAAAGTVLASISTLQSARTGIFRGRGGETVTSVGSGGYYFHLALRLVVIGLLGTYTVKLW